MRTPRRWIIGICLGLGASAPALAAGPVTFGVKAGLDVANISNDAGFAFERKLGPAGGAFVNWAWSDRLSLAGEVLYVSKGYSLGKADATDNSGTTIGTYETLVLLDYVEVPLLARIGFPIEGPVRPAVFLGPAVAFKAREQLKLTGAVSSSAKTDAFTSTDVGIAGGAELRFRTGPGWSLLEVRYTLGLRNIADTPGAPDTKNRSLTVMAGYAF